MNESATTSGDRVRVALVGCSGLLGDIIDRAIANQSDLEVVADLPAPAAGSTLAPIDADVVLWNEADGARAAEWLGRIGRRCPRVLATVYDGREASLWELVPRRTDLGAVSLDALVATIRRAANPVRGTA